MLSENLTIAVLFADGKLRPEILEILESFPQLNLIGYTCDPDDLLDLLTEPPDLMLLGLSGEGDIPEWLQKLPQRLPQTVFLSCSANWKPDFLIRAMQVGVRDFLTLPISRTDLRAAIERAFPSTQAGPYHRSYREQRWGGHHYHCHQPGGGLGGLDHRSGGFG